MDGDHPIADRVSLMRGWPEHDSAVLRVDLVDEVWHLNLPKGVRQALDMAAKRDQKRGRS